MKITRRLALLIPINSEGKVLLQHRTPDAKIKPGHWAFFGGHIEEGEDVVAAAIREFKEELMIDLRELDFFKKYLFQEDGGYVEKHFFKISLDESEEKLKSQQQEGDDLGFFSPGDFNRLKIHQDDRRVLDDFYDGKNR